MSNILEVPYPPFLVVIVTLMVEDGGEAQAVDPLYDFIHTSFISEVCMEVGTHVG